MKQVTINLREIFNGVLVTVHTGGAFTEVGHETPERYHSSWDAAIAALPDLIQRANIDPADYMRGALKQRFDKPSPDATEAAQDPIMPELKGEGGATLASIAAALDERHKMRTEELLRQAAAETGRALAEDRPPYITGWPTIGGGAVQGDSEGTLT